MEQTYWEASTSSWQWPPSLETGDVTVDVVVIGGGIIGISAAIEIKERSPATTVLVLERALPPMGASMRNAGFACVGSLSEIAHDMDLMGKHQAVELVRRRWEGLQKLRARCGDDAIGYEHHGGHEVFIEKHAALDRIDEINGAFQAVFEEPMFTRRDELIAEHGFNNVHALVTTPYEGTIHSGALMHRLWSHAHECGVMFAISEVHQVISHHDHATVEASSGLYTARDVIVATNAFPLNNTLSIEPGRGQIVVTSPIDELRLRGSYHLDEGYVYFRNVGNRILLGGGRNLAFDEERTTTFGTTSIIQEYLEHLLHTVIAPHHTFTIAYRWSGIMGFLSEKQPFIGEIRPHIHQVFGCNGMGVALGSALAAEVASQIITPGVMPG